MPLCLQAHYCVWFAKPLGCFSPQVLRKANGDYSDISLSGPHLTEFRKSAFRQRESVSGELNVNILTRGCRTWQTIRPRGCLPTTGWSLPRPIGPSCDWEGRKAKTLSLISLILLHRNTFLGTGGHLCCLAPAVVLHNCAGRRLGQVTHVRHITVLQSGGGAL
jgi:hypothetical protein